ncbi:15643_t:CDS:2 [Cetraspora pellucida]|uniref:15643_t:CDS:1 n=1 Tax=Cetraspora pellucida TaxID=1433469 RepID=A0A9N9CAM4_9GLOM|nr:15643_t:CDS:2 [Cetraspora pellucida]
MYRKISASKFGKEKQHFVSDPRENNETNNFDSSYYHAIRAL